MNLLTETAMHYFSHARTKNATPILPLTAKSFGSWIKQQDTTTQQWVKQHQFTAEPGKSLIVPGSNGTMTCVLTGVDASTTIWSLAHLPSILPAGHYRIDAKWKAADMQKVALGFALAQYQFARYKKAPQKRLVLELPAAIDLTEIEEMVSAYALVRDLINTPPNDMGPAELARAARDMAKRTGARFSEVVGDELIRKNYPAIHAVGRASSQPPRLIEINHGKQSHPLVVLVGKGVTFDTGGLDIKPYSAMKLMKKDMGGAALVLGLAQLIISLKLRIRLRVLIPAVENSISGNALRPQDIIESRKGLSIEIGSPDAEGRLILADALAEGDSGKPALMIDVATLTGAARSALGTELPALYSNDETVAQELMHAAIAEHDPMWHMPLWAGYAKYVSSTIADVTNTPNYGFAGSITAALFLQRFVSDATPWIHLDSYAWNAEAQPGRPVGGEALGLRALFTYLQTRFA